MHTVDMITDYMTCDRERFRGNAPPIEKDMENPSKKMIRIRIWLNFKIHIPYQINASGLLFSIVFVKLLSNQEVIHF